jgi:hypothetical protein
MSVDPYGERRVVDPGETVVHERIVERPAATPLVAERRTLAARRFNPASVVAVMVAIALGVVGAVAIARAGLDEPLDEPIVEVAGVTHTAVLGLIEIGMALVLLWAGLSRDRGAMLFISILFGTTALVAAIEPSVGGDTLAIERGWAVSLVVAFAIVALAAAVAPSVWRSTERVDRI